MTKSGKSTLLSEMVDISDEETIPEDQVCNEEYSCDENCEDLLL